MDSSYPPEEKVINLFMNYETLGNLQPAHSGIFEFIKALPQFAEEKASIHHTIRSNGYPYSYRCGERA